jgi:glycosyltransferase 2 family protein
LPPQTSEPALLLGETAERASAAEQEPQAVALAQSAASATGATASKGRPQYAKRLVLNLITIAVTVAFSYFALRGVKLAQAWHALDTSDYWWLLPAFVTFALSIAARALRWRSLFAPARRPPLGDVSNAMLVGYFFNNVLPARAGEAARIVVLNQRAGTPAVEIVGTVVVERLYDVVAILVIFFAAKPWLPHVSWFGAAAIASIALAAIIVTVAIVLAIYGERPLLFVLAPLRRFRLFSGDRLDHAVSELVHGLSGLRNKSVALTAFVWTIAAWLLSALSAYLVLLAFPALHLPLAAGVLVVVAVGLGMILPSPPAAVGVFEGAALIGLNAYGISHSQALPYALVLHALNFVPFVVFGAVVVHHNARTRLRGSRATAAAAASS